VSARDRRPLRSGIAWTSDDRIVVRGHDLTRLIGSIGLGEMAFLELMGRLPEPEESTMFNALCVTLVEHGLTPSAMATRLTMYGAPESLQGAVAAGLLGLGQRFGGPVEDAARMLQEGVAAGTAPAEIVAAFRARRRPVPGLGHPQHTQADPRVPRLFEVAAQNGFQGRHAELLEQLAVEAERAAGRRLPINATGAMGAIASDMGIPWRTCRGLAVMARAIGLVAHVQEELGEPLAPEVMARVDDDAEIRTD